jgi:serine/threonine protein kinase
MLEYGKHGTLRDLFQKGPIKDALMLSIVRELVGAIEHIHSRKVIHRDLKPENILVRALKPIDLMLADFGIASLSDATQHFTTKSRTIKYGAPEAAAGAVGNASDYWSLGLIVLEGISGKHPFDGLSDLAIAVQLATRGVDVAEIKNARWRGLCKGLLARDPQEALVVRAGQQVD